MTPEEHNKFLGISHLVYGGLFGLMMVAMLIFFWFIIGLSGSQQPPDGPPAALFFMMFLFMSLFYGMLIIPSFIAGYGLLRRRKWARLASIIAGVLAGMSFPIGTAVCIYTFWFLFSEPGKTLYDKPASALPPPPPNWAGEASFRKREPQYVPPASPPDWR
jgi:hypothetical protein